ncbi:MAG: molybdenum cofactor biosynthesis protein MoaE [Desulfobacterium sp.]|jgi:molybdopterin synthase catalytic subunit|nr:molybdenum cofactor biosynthesis protein MoaE [Desulfobacterium sp.]
MDINRMIEQVKSLPDYPKVGMILSHNGVVRSTTREGREVTGLRVSVDQEGLDRLIKEQKKRPGIVEVLVEIRADQDLAVGQDVMAIVVAGDIRERVIETLTDTLEQVKTKITTKQQFFKDPEEN